ncbi:MAG TPA: hypothetical protein VMV90_07285 [Rectinemataceae bacterium]|nr:hypothetical protein [Rectinemataceae bacterium]
MRLTSEDLLGRVTFVTGPEKACGKTTLVKRLLALARAEGERAALLTVGFEGEPGGRTVGDSRRPTLECLPGEIFISAERYLRSSSCLPEVLEVLPGSTAFGRLAIARARRRGRVVLVGAERNEYAAWAVERIRREAWARTVLVDGALNRITQASAFRDARFLFVLRLSPGELERGLRGLRRIHRLVTLPVLPAASDERSRTADTEAARRAGLPLPLAALDGPLTARTLSEIPDSARTILVEDFTKVFLDAPALASLARARVLAVRAGIEFGGFVVALRDLSRERFTEALDDPSIEDLVVFNPGEAAYA